MKGGEAHTTNNRMELMAAISALEALKKPCAVDLNTDSQYVRQGITGWIHGWKKNGWRTADKKPVKNVDLWQRLDAALKPHQVRWHWVKGHAGHAENERADELAREGVAMARLKEYGECSAEAVSVARAAVYCAPMCRKNWHRSRKPATDVPAACSVSPPEKRGPCAAQARGRPLGQAVRDQIELRLARPPAMPER